MKYVVDANIILSGLIADSMTRRLLVELEDGLLTPAYVYDEVGAYTEMVSEKAGLSPAAVEELMELLFERIDLVPRPVVLESLQEAARIMRNTDPDDAVYLASALERDATCGATTATTRGRMPSRSREQTTSSSDSNSGSSFSR